MYVLLKNGNPVYCGSTCSTVENRIRWHYNTLGQMRTWNPALAEFFQHCQGYPEYREVATVDDAERYSVEAQVTRQLRKRHSLLNVLDGKKHTPESIKRILAGKARAKASRSGSPPGS